MFTSFFPRPALFFSTATIWSLMAVLIWFDDGSSLPFHLSQLASYAGKPMPDNAWRFIQPSQLWFYCYYAAIVGMFALPWFILSPHRWQYWSVLGSALIIFVTWFDVLVGLSKHVASVPVLGHIPYALVVAALLWSLYPWPDAADYQRL